MTTPKRTPKPSVLDRVLDAVRPYRKAIAGFVGPGVGSLGYALLPGSPGDSAITANEWRGALAAVLLGAFAVYVAPKNEPNQ